MKRLIMKLANYIVLTVFAFMMTTGTGISDDNLQSANKWQTPPEDIMKVLHAPKLPWVWTAPTGENFFLADPVLFPKLAEMAAPMHKLACIRVNPVINARHGQHTGSGNRNTI